MASLINNVASSKNSILSSVQLSRCLAKKQCYKKRTKTTKGACGKKTSKLLNSVANKLKEVGYRHQITNGVELIN